MSRDSLYQQTCDHFYGNLPILFWSHIILFPRFFSRALRFREWAITSVACSAPLRFEKPKSSMAPIKAGEQSKKMHSKVVSVSYLNAKKISFSNSNHVGHHWLGPSRPHCSDLSRASQPEPSHVRRLHGERLRCWWTAHHNHRR